jgi:hypothetical protein
MTAQWNVDEASARDTAAGTMDLPAHLRRQLHNMILLPSRQLSQARWRAT